MDEGDAIFETAAPAGAGFDAAEPPGHGHVALDGSGRVRGEHVGRHHGVRRDVVLIERRSPAAAP
nr:hypothetical protein [Streptomyces zinciresistens]